MLISARDAVVVTYSDRHGTQPSPPAAVVAEFLDVLDQSFEWRDRDGKTYGSARRWITKRHPLHAHDAAYFTGEQLFTYEPTHAVVRNRGKRLFHEYLGGSELPPMPCEGLTLDDLSGALANPVRCLFERRFRVTLPHDEVLLADDEPWDLRPLDRAALARNLTDALQTGEAYEAVANRAQALSKVAPGEIGRSDLEEVRRLTVRQGRYLEAHQLLNSPVAQIPIRISGPPLPCPLEGRIALAGDATLVQRRFGSRHAQHLLGNWILHLAACCQLGSQIRTRLLFKDEVIIFTAPEDPASLLAALCETALAAHRELIPFSPNPSLKYVERMLEPKKSKTPHETALQEAAASWQVEAERDSWASICAPGYSPVDSSEFGPLARKLLEPLLNQMATESYP
jgi:exonuclease V gamma subunit